MDSLPVLEPSLAAVVAPASVNEFLEHYWKREVFYCPGSPRRVEPVLRELGPTAVAGLVWQSAHCAVLQSHSNERGSARPSTAAALEAYEKRGATLYCRMKNDWPLARWTSALAEELGEPPIGVTGVFAVHAGNGTLPHYDWNENFTIQILGSKRWLVAGGFVTHPVSNWRIGDPAPPYSDAACPPGEMPADAQEYLLTPGSVLYVPRGYLHQATANGTADSLSLSMSLPPTPWAVVLCTLLSERLLEDAEFREALCGAFGRGWGAEKLLERLPGKMDKFCRNAKEVGDALLDIMHDPEKLKEYLVKSKYPRY